VVALRFTIQTSRASTQTLKDEVRKVVVDWLARRNCAATAFGPGLAIRIIGEVTASVGECRPTVRPGN